MSIDEPKSAENLIGDMSFGITTNAIEKQASEMREELGQINLELAKENVDQRLREFCQNRKTKIEAYLTASTDEIFCSLRAVYDFVVAHEQQGILRDDILQAIVREKPELVESVSKYYDILRTQTWGYRVFQYLYAIKLRS